MQNREQCKPLNTVCGNLSVIPMSMRGGTQQEGDHGWSGKRGQLPRTGEVMDLEGGPATTTLLNELGP